jgi:hypothetical protein
MSCKSAIYTANTSPQSVASGGTIALGSVQRRFGDSIRLNGNGITLAERGYYDVDVSVTAAPLVAGTVVVSLYSNGVAVPGAVASGSVTTAGNPVSLSFPAIIRVACCGNPPVLTLTLTGNASTVTNAAVSVAKL